MTPLTERATDMTTDSFEAFSTQPTVNGGSSGYRLHKLVSDSDFPFAVLACLGSGFVIACCGIFTNAINIKTFITMGVEDGVTTLFLSISCSDFAFNLLTSLRNFFNSMDFVEFFEGDWLFSISPIGIAFFCDNCAFVMYTVTVLTSTFLAVARCMCVAKPLQFKHIFTRTRSLIALVPIFLFPIVAQSVVFAHMGMERRFDPRRNASRISLWFSNDRERVKDIVRLILESIFPILCLVVITICVVVMVYKLREAAHFRRGTTQGQGQTTENPDTEKEKEKDKSSTKLTGKDRQVVKQVVLICVIFIVLNILKVANTVAALVEPKFDFMKQYHNTSVIIRQLITVCDVLNASVNIFVYYFFNTKFRSLCFTC